MMNIKEIMSIIPHRPPFLLIDKVLSLEPGKKITAVKNVTMNEPFFVGHFPNEPVMPGVLIIEAMAQAGAVAILSKPGQEGKTAYFAGIQNAKFKKKVNNNLFVDFWIVCSAEKVVYGTVKVVGYFSKTNICHGLSFS